MYKLLIIEDDSVIAGELKTLLERNGYEAETLKDFKTPVTCAIQAAPHLILLDLNLPVYDGFYICREIRKQSDIPIIIVTSRDSELDELMSLNLGADHFVTKPYHTQILLAKISTVLNRTYPAKSSKFLSYNQLTLDLLKSQITYNETSLELTKNEFRILQMLMEHRDQIVSREDMIQALWQTDSFIDDNTLTVNVNRLRKKLSEIGAADMLKTHRGLGYSL